MAASNINRVVISGNLTRDPDLRSLPSGNSVCSLRIATNTRRKENGEWVDKPNYFSVTVWGAQGENCNRFLTKGRPVAIDGRLEWREWQDKEGNKRESVEIVADSVQFLGGPADGNGGGYSGAQAGAGNGFAPHSDVPADTSDFQPVGARSSEGRRLSGSDRSHPPRTGCRRRPARCCGRRRAGARSPTCPPGRPSAGRTRRCRRRCRNRRCRPRRASRGTARSRR